MGKIFLKNFRIVNFPFISGKIPSAAAYGVYTFQLICYSRVWRRYTDFINRAKLLSYCIGLYYISSLFICSTFVDKYSVIRNDNFFRQSFPHFFTVECNSPSECFMKTVDRRWYYRSTWSSLPVLGWARAAHLYFKANCMLFIFVI